MNLFETNGLLFAFAAAVLLSSGARDISATGVADIPHVAKLQLAGTVYDSTLGGPLRGARVQLVHEANPGRVRLTQADSIGRFVFDSLQAGRYLVGFEHPRLDSLLVESPVRVVEMADTSETVEVILAVPSVAALTKRFCDTEGREPHDALMLGRLRGVDQARPQSGPGVVRARWRQLLADESSLRTRTDSSEVRLQLSPDFALCGLPPGGSITIQAWFGADSSGAIALQVPENGVLLRDLFVASSGVRSPDSADGVATQHHQTPRILIGVVRDTAGVGIPDARVTGPDPEREVRTDSAGRFALDGIPGGTQAVVVRALGFQPSGEVVDVTDGPSRELVVVLRQVPVTLSAVRVTARRSYAGFEARRHRGAGIYLDEEIIKRRKPWVVADLMKLQPGVRVLPSGDGEPQFMMRFNRRSCEPSVYVDGRELLGKTRDLDAYVNTSGIRAVEIYSVPAEVPLEFSSNILCGAVIIWTHKP